MLVLMLPLPLPLPLPLLRLMPCAIVRALAGPTAPSASAAFVRQHAALADFVDLYTDVPNGARTSYAGASSSAIAAPKGAGAADAPPLAPTAGLHSAKVVPTRRPLAAQRSAVTPRVSAAPRTRTAEFDAEVKERFNKWSTGMYAKNSFLFEIGATACLEQRDRIREELEVEWRAAGRPLFREAEQLLVRGDLNTTAPRWIATLRAAPSSGGPRVGQQQSEAAASREVCDEVLRRLDLDPDAPIDPDACDMALRGLRWEELLGPQKQHHEKKAVETTAASNLRAPTRPMARGGDAKMHSTPSRDDGVEHTSASVAAAASATTALRRQLRPATPAAAAAPLAAGRWRPKTMEDATKYGEKHAQLSGVMPYDWCSASLFSKGPDKVAGRHRTKGLFLHYPRESPHNGYVTPEGHGTDHTMRLLERAMQGPAGACLLETIDYLDDLDGPNPLKMGKQKYCFVKHFWRTLNLAQKDQWRVAKVRKLSSVMVDEIVLRGSTGMDCIVAGKNPLKIWPLLLTTAAKIAVEEASAELGRIVEYDIAFGPLADAVEGEEDEEDEEDEEEEEEEEEEGDEDEDEDEEHTLANDLARAPPSRGWNKAGTPLHGDFLHVQRRAATACEPQIGHGLLVRRLARLELCDLIALGCRRRGLGAQLLELAQAHRGLAATASEPVFVRPLPRRPSFRPRSGRRLDLGLAGTLSIGCLLRLERAQLCLPSDGVRAGLA